MSALKDWDGELLSRKRLKLVASKEATGTSNVKVRFAMQTLAQVLAHPPLQWLVEGIFPQRGLVCWYGQPTCGKTFLALDASMNVARGSDEWFGRAMTGVPVIYVAGEGVGGLSNRLRSWVARHCNPDAEPSANIRIVAEPPNLFDGDAGEFAETIRAIKPGLVVIDTLARSSTGADENSARDMGKVIQACDFLVKSLNCCVLLVHHSKKGMSGGERGSSALRGACDVMLEIKNHHKEGIRELVLSGAEAKIKDGAESESVYFRLEVEGESCIVVPAHTPPPDGATGRPQPRGASQQLVYDLAGQALRERSGRVEGRPTITFTELLERWQGAVQDVRKREPGQLRRVLNSLIAAGVLAGTDSAIWCP